MEQLKHDCGIALVRLRKPLAYYIEKYGTPLYGLNKLYLLMEKQHNRGQEGAGFAVVKQDASPGDEYLFRERALGSNAIADIFSEAHKKIAQYSYDQLYDASFASGSIPFLGENYLGHLRYSTTKFTGLTFVHPMVRRSNWRAKTLALCGNFNLTNVEAVFKSITDNGQHPRNTSDTHILLDQIGHALDREVERLYKIGRTEYNVDGMEVTRFIEDRVDMARVLKKCSPLWDGGYVMCGMSGSGDNFVFRDPQGIRPAFYYVDEEIVVAASERPVIQTAMNVTSDKIKELERGEALLVNKNGDYRIERILPANTNKACSFERIYFSRGSDIDIYKERKSLGRELVSDILKSIDNDLDNTVFSFIPNTAEVAYYGMLEGLNEFLNQQKKEAITSLYSSSLSEEEKQQQLKQVLSRKVRSEKVAIKDIKLRTFIAEGDSRDTLAAHVYDVTYGSIRRNQDNLVIIDDSIVRGTTLKQSILSILDRLGPVKVVIVSSSPQIRYPDYYGIDMTKMEEFVAFRAAVALHKQRGTESLLLELYKKALQYRNVPLDQYVENVVKEVYAPFTSDELSAMIVELIRPESMRAEVRIVYQSMEGLQKAIPNHPGIWYFDGNYPTAGGSHLVNEAFIQYIENNFLSL